MKRHITCLGAINLDLLFEVSDVEEFLAAWGTGLLRGGEEVLSPGEEKRLKGSCPGLPVPPGVQAAARLPTQPMPWPVWRSRLSWWAG
jgi:hypothetical protein